MTATGSLVQPADGAQRLLQRQNSSRLVGQALRRLDAPDGPVGDDQQLRALLRQLVKDCVRLKQYNVGLRHRAQSVVRHCVQIIRQFE